MLYCALAIGQGGKKEKRYQLMTKNVSLEKHSYRKIQFVVGKAVKDSKKREMVTTAQ